VLLSDMVEQWLSSPVGQVEQVLHRSDRGDALGGIQLFDTDFTQADVPDLALSAQQREFSDLILERYLRVDAVQLL